MVENADIAVVFRLGLEVPALRSLEVLLYSKKD